MFNLLIFQLAQLSSDDMIAVNNMRYLGGSDTKKASGSGFSLKFDISKVTACAPKFMIIDLALQELIEKLSNGNLPKDEYPCMNDPCPTFHGTSQNASVRTTHAQPAQAHSVRSRPTATWARPRNSDDGYSRIFFICSDSILRHSSSDLRKMGQRIFIFIIGGATRSEVAQCLPLHPELTCPHDELSQLDQLQDYGKGLGPQVPGSRVGLESATFSHLKVVRECKAKAFLPRRPFLLAIGRQTAPFPSVHVQRWSNDRISRRWRRWRCGWPCND
ncbi:hypothetical protein GW17_00005759 [Ensete ventricosum]|nr:hypothetical protein GW17_00005759 [Ensete ventricosum]